MRIAVLERIACPGCAAPVRHETFRASEPDRIDDGVAWCDGCGQWWPIEDQLLELLPPELGYTQDRLRFWSRYRAALTARGLAEPLAPGERSSYQAQLQQQLHFDWYANNNTQTYSAYEQMPFWRIVDDLTFARWRAEIAAGNWLLDVGCAQGRSSLPLLDSPIEIVGVDIAKHLVRQAITAMRARPHKARATYFVADASRLPFRAESFDNVLIYGVLHHLPKPGNVCREVARVLKPGGVYFGSENNQTWFRPLFEFLQRILPIWHEEAGEQPLISAKQLKTWFAGTGVTVSTHTHVFAPPHLVNLLGQRGGAFLVRATDAVGRSLPLVRHQGGLVVIHASKQAGAARAALAAPAAIRQAG